jgi:hypothetical protein
MIDIQLDYPYFKGQDWPRQVKEKARWVTMRQPARTFGRALRELLSRNQACVYVALIRDLVSQYHHQSRTCCYANLMSNADYLLILLIDLY